MTFVSQQGRSFLVDKILINTRILWDPFLIKVPLIRVNRGVQDISLYRYSQRSSQAMLDPLASLFPSTFITIGLSPHSKTSRQLYGDALSDVIGPLAIQHRCFRSSSTCTKPTGQEGQSASFKYHDLNLMTRAPLSIAPYSTTPSALADGSWSTIMTCSLFIIIYYYSFLEKGVSLMALEQLLLNAKGYLA